MRNAVLIYLIWAIFLISTGIYVVRHISDMSNPNSLGSSFKKLNETIENEDIEIP